MEEESNGAAALTTADESRLRAIAAWIVGLCDLYALRAEQSHHVAALFAAGLRREWEKQEEMTDA